MTTSELKSYIDRTLGNSLRCLLPSYWWKRLFGLFVDEVERINAEVKRNDDAVKKANSNIATLTSNLNEKSESFLLYGGNPSSLQIAFNGETIWKIKDAIIAKKKIDVTVVLNDITVIKPSLVYYQGSTIWVEYISSANEKIALQFTSREVVRKIEKISSSGIEFQESPTYSSVTLQPNKYCKIERARSSLTVSLAEGTGGNVVDNYMLEFSTASDFYGVTWPDGLQWQNGEEPEVVGGWTYQVSIVNNLAVIAKF